MGARGQDHFLATRSCGRDWGAPDGNPAKSGVAFDALLDIENLILGKRLVDVF